ncbi:hypothetical protein NBRC10513_000978 [Rhodotorula toruloides]
MDRGEDPTSGSSRRVSRRASQRWEDVLGLWHSADRSIVQVITAEEVAKHNTAESAWVIIEGGVYDVTDFLEDHPGGKKVLLKGCGQDSTEKFHSFHSRKVLDKTAKPYLIGKVGEASKL